MKLQGGKIVPVRVFRDMVLDVSPTVSADRGKDRYDFRPRNRKMESGSGEDFGILNVNLVFN